MPLVAWSPKTQASRAIARAAFVEVKVQVRNTSIAGRNLAKTTLVDAFFTLRIRLSESPLLRTASESAVRQDARSRSKKLVELIGVEPTTSSLQSWRSTN